VAGAARSLEVLEEPRWIPYAHIRRYESLSMQLSSAA
jgi:hypothetical protein